jgi:methionyl-tRNA formyltransferase
MRGDPRVDLVGVVTGRLDDAALQSSEPDVLVSAAHEHLIREETLAVPRLGSVGLHPSLLPRYRGAYPLWWALRRGESECGLTIYRMGPGLDDGPILGQRRVPILGSDTFATLYARVTAEVAPLLDELTSEVWATGRLPKGRPQSELEATYVRTPRSMSRAAMKSYWYLRRLIRTSGQVR